MRLKFLTIAAAVGLGVLFAGPDITNATPLTPISSSTVTNVAEQSGAVEQVRWRGHRCWNCGYRRGYGAPLYFGFGFGYPYYGGYGYPYYGGYGYGGYYGGRYYRHGRHYSHHRYYRHDRRHR